eukprot:s4288_g6.t1
MSGEEAEDLEEPEALDLRQHIISSGEAVEFEYTTGVLQVDTSNSSIVAVAEVDQQLLVAVPEAAWHKTRRKRRVDPDALRKAIAVLVPFCDSSDRFTADPSPATKIWLGSGQVPPGANAKAANKRPSLPPGVDPAVAQQALLQKWPEALGLPAQAPLKPVAEESSGEEEDPELAAIDLGGGSGSANPMEAAVLR